MNLYSYLDYRELIRDLVAERKKIDSGVNYQRMAQVIRVPKSYVSKVMKGASHFSPDQTFQVGKFLQFGDDEQRYLQLLVEYSRTGVFERRNQLLSDIRQLQSRKLQTQEHLVTAKTVDTNVTSLAEYYLDPLNQIVHICLSIERYAGNLPLLAKDLGAPVSKILTAANSLERLGIVSRQKDRYQVAVRHMHLPPDSTIYQVWRSQLKLLAMQRMANIDAVKTYSFAAVFSTEPEVQRKIRAKILETLSAIEKMVTGTPQQDTFQLSIDLFQWN